MAHKLSLFSSPESPESQETGENTLFGLIGIYFVAFLIFPVATLVYGLWIGLFTYARLPWWIPAPLAGIFTMLGLITSGISPNGIVKIFESWGKAISSIGKYDSVFSIYFHMMVSQAIVSLWVSTTAAAFIIAWKWRHAPKWQERNIIPGPVLHKRLKQNRIAIESGVDSPTSGITLGLSRDERDPNFAGGKPGAPYGTRVVISDQESSGHALVVGGSGSGKTRTMLVGMRDVIRLGRGLVIIDLKGGPDVPYEVANWAHRYGREFLHWSITDAKIGYYGPADSPAYYDPISRGDASRRKDLLIGSQRWDIEYYKNVVANYLQTAFGVMSLVPALEGIDTFSDLAELLSPSSLQRRAQYIESVEQPELLTAVHRLEELGPQELSGIRAMYDRIQTLTSSTAGAWLRKDPEGLRDINFRKVADEGQVVVFSLDSSNYEDTANLIAGLIIQDLKTLSSELRNDPAPTPLHIYVDEFSSIDSTNILGLLAKARDARMPVTLATQALADLQRREAQFVDQVLGIVTLFIVHRANTEVDARIYAGLSGVVKKRVERMGVSQTGGAFGKTLSTGSGFSEEREDYAVAIGTFQHLKLGYCVFIAKSPVARYVNPVQIVMENENLANLKADPAVVINYPEKVYYEPEHKTYPHPTTVESGKFIHPAQPAIESHDIGAWGNIVPTTQLPTTGGPVRPKRPVVKPTGQGKEAGAPIPLPTLKPDSALTKPARAPMPIPEMTKPKVEPVAPKNPSEQSNDEWMMP